MFCRFGFTEQAPRFLANKLNCDVIDHLATFIMLKKKTRRNHCIMAFLYLVCLHYEGLIHFFQSPKHFGAVVHCGFHIVQDCPEGYVQPCFLLYTEHLTKEIHSCTFTGKLVRVHFLSHRNGPSNEDCCCQLPVVVYPDGRR